MKSLYWYNDDVRETLRSWPTGVIKDLGHQMRDVQSGSFPVGAKVLQGVSPHVIQLKSKGHRVVVTAAIGDVIWALHAFEKDANHTRRQDVELIQKRVAELEARHRRSRSH